ncbi:hypothetical protein [Natrinema sp. CBA1119]|uniref:hypothetical protein n=1 Tax=Natrinema sp. CBA1119 TaxID=1608465 RepID=UPI00159BD2AB|nr:hypothetical protein [Natrinema sp. CBA1119]
MSNTGTYRRWHAGQGSRPCVGCGAYFAPGHAVESTREGTAHVDCDDHWMGYFDD